MTTKPPQCPQCQAQQHAADVSFCFQCRFPLMKIAGKYRLDKLLAEGGQGAVYLAHHVDLDYDSARVIKLIRPELFDTIPHLDERFRREVQVTSALSQRCQHIVRIYDDFGNIPELGSFYVMEYLQGQPLSSLLKDPQQLPSLAICVHIFLQLCDAMRYAHRADIIHRDLKPDNLMLVEFEEEPLFVKLLDFGIARPTGPQSEDQPKLTQGVVGTPEYMAPEQLTGKEVDERTDIYAMGVILYEMLTGQTPHAPRSVGQEALFELVMRVFAEPPLPPSQLRPEREISPALEAVVMRCLSQKPEDRFADVLELKTAVREARRQAPQDDETLLESTFEEEEPFLAREVSARFTLEPQGEAPPPASQTVPYPGAALRPEVPEGPATDPALPPHQEAVAHHSLLKRPIQTQEDEDFGEATSIEFRPPASWMDDIHDPTRESKAMAPAAKGKRLSMVNKLLLLSIPVLLLAVGGLALYKEFKRPVPEARSLEGHIRRKAPAPPARERRPQPMAKAPDQKQPLKRPPGSRPPGSRPRARRPKPSPRFRRSRPQLPLRRPRKKRRLPRRIRPRARPAPRVGRCPSTGGFWLRVRISPGHGKPRLLPGRRGQLRSAGIPGQFCIGFGQSTGVAIKVPGYRLCHVELKRGDKAMHFALEREKEKGIGMALGDNDYCKKPW